MDRERKLLFTALFFGAVLAAMNITQLCCYPPERGRTLKAALLNETACQKQLIHAWAQCAPRHLRNPQEF